MAVVAKTELGLLEEDDEFEEFAAEGIFHFLKLRKEHKDICL